MAIWLINNDVQGITELLADEGLAKYDQDDYTLKEAIASEGKDREEEKTKLEAEMMENS